MIKKRIVVVEDDQDLRYAYELIINSSPFYKVVGLYSSCETCIKEIRKVLPDIILMDIGLPKMNGVDGTRRIKKILPYIEIIMISVHEDSDLVFDALKSGASGYISKSSNFQELLQAIDEIVKGGAPMSSKIARLVVDDFHRNNYSPLSERETQILQSIYRGKSYVQIGEELKISKTTVKTHTRNIYKKLHVKKKSEAISIALRDKMIR